MSVALFTVECLMSVLISFNVGLLWVEGSNRTFLESGNVCCVN